MHPRPTRAGRRLLYKSFLIVITGLLAIGLLLDWLLISAESNDELRKQEQFLTGSFLFVEKTLIASSPEKWQKKRAYLAQQLHTAVDIILLEQAAIPASLTAALDNGSIVRLFNNDDKAVYYRQFEFDSTSEKRGRALITIGPFEDTASNNSFIGYLSPLYYAAIFLLIWLWLRPFIRDIELLDRAAHRLGLDYNAVTPELKEIGTLKVLATTFANMASQLKRMILSQKEMTNALSHELRTPLSRIKFSMAVLDKHVDDEVRQELQRISTDVSEIDTLIDKMLHYAKLEHSGLAIHPTTIQTEQWLTSLCEKNLLAQLGKQWQLSIDNNARTIIADEELLSLALSNLLANAARYANHHIHVKCAAFTSHKNGWCISVSDDGHGIPETDLDNVFKAFTRVDESRNRQTGGYGLGLAIVDKIAHMHNGYCTASKSELGGACLSIYSKTSC